MARDTLSNLVNRAGESISLETWLSLRGDNGYCRIGLWTSAELVVSTAWIGIEGQIFETQIQFFSVQHGDEERVEIYRWKSEGEAINGHEQAIKSSLRLSPPTIQEYPV